MERQDHYYLLNTFCLDSQQVLAQAEPQNRPYKRTKEGDTTAQHALILFIPFGPLRVFRTPRLLCINRVS